MYYAKYRPQKFSELSEPNDVAKALSTQVKNDATVHAYLFVGSRGTGKTTTARLLAKALNCSKVNKEGDPCGKCDVCKGIQNGSFLDLIEIDAASNRGIDDIRELKEKIKLVPSNGKRKVYIIDEVHMLTPEAFNALLKTLEEPPPHANFVLCTTEFHKVPETIRSRCQVFKFKRATVPQLVAKLEEIAKEEGTEVDKQSLGMIASAAQGGFRDAKTLLQQVIEGDLDVSSLVNLGTKESYLEFLDLLITNNPKEALHRVNKLVEDGVDLYVWTGELLKYLRDLLYLKAGAFESGSDAPAQKEMLAQANSVDSAKLTYTINAIMEAQNKVKETFITQLPLELAIVDICAGGHVLSGRAQESLDPVDPADSGGGDSPYFKIGSKPSESTEVSAPADDTTEDSSKLEVVVKTEKTVVEIEETTVVEQVADEEPAINFDEVTSKWKEIITQVATVNGTVAALLRSAVLSGVSGKNLLLDVPYDFHRERLHSLKNRSIVEGALRDLLKTDLVVVCTVKKLPKKKFAAKETGKLTDYNVTMPSGVPTTEMPEDVLEVFDGGLPF